MEEQQLDFEKIGQKLEAVMNEVEKVIVGKRDVLRLTLAGMLADGHILFEDVPGVGKTMLVKSLAAALLCRYKRVQFTPELMPADIAGVNIYDNQAQDFKFLPGPVFTNLLLADEINRGTPRTQSALLEAMAERQVTIDGQTHILEDPFVVLATQNPIESEGTYLLPEAQLDRFMMQLTIGYPQIEEELMLLDGKSTQERLKEIRPVLSLEEFRQLKKIARSVFVAPTLLTYALKLVRATRENEQIHLGVSTRGAIAFVDCAKAYALLSGREYCVPGDFAAVYQAVFAHRILLRSGLRHKKQEKEQVLSEIFQSIQAPVKG